MAGPKPIRWLLALGVPLLVVVGLSLWAIDKPNVTWRATPGQLGALTPVCPLCRTEVRMYATRCPTCQQDVEWVVAPKEDSPICPLCLSAGESEGLAARRRTLGEEASAERVSKTLRVAIGPARAWLSSVGPGTCGWCGGTGHDPSAEGKEDCPVCFGEDDCIGCGGSRRVTIGKEDAEIRLRRYERMIAGLGSETPVARAREEIREANDDFLGKDAGTLEAQALLFWPAYRESPLEAPGISRAAFQGQPRAGDRARERVVQVLQALKD